MAANAAGVVLLGLGLFGDGENLAIKLAARAVGAVLTFVGVTRLSALFAGPTVAVFGRPPGCWAAGCSASGWPCLCHRRR